MSDFFPKDKDELAQKFKNIEDFLRIEVDHALMKYGPEGSLVVECKECRHRTIVNIERWQGSDEIISMIMKWVRDVEFARLTLLAAIADSSHPETDRVC